MTLATIAKFKIRKSKNPRIDWFYSIHLTGTYDSISRCFTSSRREVGVFYNLNSSYILFGYFLGLCLSIGLLM